MNQQEMDRLLGETLRERFSLPRGVEDALWGEFVRRHAEEKRAWAGFGAALACASARLRETVRRCAWPMPLVGNLAWR